MRRCIGKISVFMNHGFYIENDRSTDADVLTTWHTILEKYLV